MSLVRGLKYAVKSVAACWKAPTPDWPDLCADSAVVVSRYSIGAKKSLTALEVRDAMFRFIIVLVK